MAPLERSIGNATPDQLFRKYSSAVTFVEVEDRDQTPGIGTATHVGEGVYVTARHVVENKRILHVGSHSGDTIQGTLVFHPDERVDLAAFRVSDQAPHEATCWVPLGGHLEDWLGPKFVLSEVVVMGYPPIPMTREPYLVAARAEVNAIVDYRDVPHANFVLSAMARGGFSGAMAIDHREFGLGVVVSSMLDGTDLPPELGYMSTTSIEPVYELLAAAKLLPQCQAEGWDGLWNSSSVDFSRPDDEGWGHQLVASVTTFDDGRFLWMKISAADPALRAQAVELVIGHLELGTHAADSQDNGHVATVTPMDYGAADSLHAAASLAADLLEERLEGTTRGWFSVPSTTAD